MGRLSSGHSSLYMTFRIEEELFAVDVEKVHEISDPEWAVKIPGAPGFMVGGINLPGLEVPVLDPRMKFGMAGAENLSRRCIVVLEVNRNGETFVLGILVDSTRGVIELARDQIETPYDNGDSLKKEFIKGVGRQKDENIFILDMDRIFTSDELSLVDMIFTAAIAMELV